MTRNREIVCLLEDLICELTKYEPDDDYLIHLNKTIERLEKNSALDDLEVIDILKMLIRQDGEVKDEE